MSTKTPYRIAQERIEKALDLNSKELDLSSLKLTRIPPQLKNLKNLTILTLSDNNLKSLPAFFGELSNLIILNLDGNKLSSLPTELKLTRLWQLNLSDNPLPLPLEILQKNRDPSAIFTAYFDPRQPLHEAKLILVGQGSVGKTSLVRRLVENRYNEEENKTEGISISKWSLICSLKGEKKYDNKASQDIVMQINIWDFGGQEIMHATHQFFLTKRSLYLLILNSRISQEENCLEYWLKDYPIFRWQFPSYFSWK